MTIFQEFFILEGKSILQDLCHPPSAFSLFFWCLREGSCSVLGQGTYLRPFFKFSWIFQLSTFDFPRVQLSQMLTFRIFSDGCFTFQVDLGNSRMFAASLAASGGRLSSSMGCAHELSSADFLPRAKFRS